MTGLYNIINNGTEPTSAIVMMILNEEKLPRVPRFRDAWIEKEGDVYFLVVFTRTGGGNRECYCDTDEHEDDCYPHMNEQLEKHPLYIKDSDDDFDSTYAHFYFKVPEKYKEVIKELHDKSGNPKSLKEKTDIAIEQICKTIDEQKTKEKEGQP